MKYNEDEILMEVHNYIASTYGQHYAGDKEVQLFDYWQSLGILTPVAIGTAIKYLGRYGKKEGKNKKDLLKAIHYVVLAMHDQFYTNQPDQDLDPPSDLDEDIDPDVLEQAIRSLLKNETPPPYNMVSQDK